MITLEFRNNFLAPNEFYKLQKSLKPHHYPPVELSSLSRAEDSDINTGQDGGTGRVTGRQTRVKDIIILTDSI